MKGIGIVGSPRKGGNTETLVSHILSGAKDRGAETRLFHLSTMAIGGCEGCGYCRSNPHCKRNDDMQTLYSEIKSANGLVIGSPVYMWQMSAQTKLFVDRLLAFLNKDFSSRLARRTKLILAFTQGQGDVKAFKAYFDQTAAMMGFLGFNVLETIVAGGTLAKKDIARQAALLKTARASGAKLAE